MAYKQKVKHRKEIPNSYWKEEEIARIRKKYKGKVPPFSVISKEGTRMVLGIPKRIHEKGELVYYKNEVARVHSVSKKGIFLQKFSKAEGLAIPTKKLMFVSEKDLDEGKVYPVFTNIPIGVNFDMYVK